MSQSIHAIVPRTIACSNVLESHINLKLVLEEYVPRSQFSVYLKIYVNGRYLDDNNNKVVNKTLTIFLVFIIVDFKGQEISALRLDDLAQRKG